MSLKPGQIKCIETLDRPIVVAAGAGSGKTFTLTKRVVHAIQSGFVDGIERVCAITFTNKAAAELKSRIKAELRACGLQEAALAVDDAWISTIHGMCARILRSHAVELGIDPGFKVAEGDLVSDMRRAAIDAVLLEVRGDDDPSVDALFAEYPATSSMRGASVESMLHDLMDALSEHPDAAKDLLDAPDARAEGLFASALDAYASLLDAAEAEKSSASRDAWVVDAQEALAHAREAFPALEAGDARSMLELLAPFKCSKKFGSKDFKAYVDEASSTLSCCIMELRLMAAAPHLETLVSLARRSLALFDAAKRKAGVLDNGDLLVMAAAAIADNPDIAACYADKFQLVMVDEFQDTDQMQVDMIKRIAGPGACRLCTVGDAQQSIYRFRGADVAVYRRHLESVRAGNPEDIIMLPDNFRSHADVLSLVDRVFERPDMFGGSFMSLAPGRDEGGVKKPFAPGERRICVQLTTKPFRGVPSEHMREVAAARLADKFARFVADGRSAGEMALLLGRMTYADVYAQAFRDRGLACVISGGSVFASTLEAQIVLELTRVAANPADTEAFYNVLSSPMFSLTADELLVLCTASDGRDGSLRRRPLDRGVLGAYRRLSDGDASFSEMPRLANAVRVMGSFCSGVGRTAVARLVMRAAVDSGWVSRLEERGAEGLAQLANVYKAIRIVEGIESAKAVGAAAVSRRFEATLAASKEAPGALSTSGGGFVRIMTVHASKGLEFPIVAVADMKDAKGDSSKLLVTELEGRVRASLDLSSSLSAIGGAVDMKNLPAVYSSVVGEDADEDDLVRKAREAASPLELRSALYEFDRIGDEEEAKRLLYVALTRAKEALVVSMQGTRTKANANGTPSNCLSAVVTALCGGDGGFAPGESSFEFGGTLPASVEHVALEPAVEGEGVQDEAAAGEGLHAAQDPDSAEEGFMVPAARERAALHRRPYAPAHEGVFSYSSVAESSHEGDLLERLVSRCFASADAPLPEDALFGSSAFGDEPDGGFPSGSRRLAARNALADADDGSWAYIGSDCSDSDKATDLGTAFHRLAQYAVVTRGGSGQLALPPVERVDALARACDIGTGQRTRLDEALARWFASDVAAAMGAFSDLRAEAPFFVSIDRSALPPVFLEGEIDLLGMGEDGRFAHVVDYKTGGHADESEPDLALKHVLQAACYAYALMGQGVDEVEATFVRVERARQGGVNQPQCVRYRFGREDVSFLREAILEAYDRACAI